MTREEIIEKVNGFLIDEFEIEEARISPDANFKDDLELESLDFVDIVAVSYTHLTLPTSDLV